MMFRITIGFFLLLLLSSIGNSQNDTSTVTSFHSDPDTIIKGSIKAFDFVGGGDLNSLSQSGGNNTAGNISVGLYYLREFDNANRFLSDLEIDFAINVSTTVNSFNLTNPRSLGNYILNPINTRQSARLDMYSLFKPRGKMVRGTLKESILSILIDGAFMRFYGSNSTWSYNSESVHITAFHYKMGLFHEFIPDAIARENNSSIMLGIVASLRAIAGDIKGNDREILRSITNDTRANFWGCDLDFGIKFNNIRAEFIIPFIKASDRGSIPGLTDTQFLTQLRFIGGFHLKINNKNSSQV